MASIFGHIAVSSALGAGLFPRQARTGALMLAGFCACAPDLDVLAFFFGVPYEDPWGHRGVTHSIVFALILGIQLAWMYSQQHKHFPAYAAWFVLSMASHPLLDMMTNGGLGVALLWPMSEERLFFSCRPILVSPLGIGNFFSEWGLRVLYSELKWIGLPCLGFVGLAILTRRIVRYFHSLRGTS